MRIQDLENVIKEENLDGANICNATSLQPYQVVITQEEGVWKVYNTDERAGLWGIVSCFDSEAEACEDFIKKLRFHKRLSELQKEIWKKIASLGAGETSSPLLWMLFYNLATISAAREAYAT